MKMTFEDYIQNPMGKENAVISNRAMYRNLYQTKLDAIMVRESGHVEIKAYHVGKKYICYLKIPSEVVPKFYYDVLIEFTPPKIISGADLKSYNVRFYSNDPSFVYTFAHAFIKNGLFFDDFKDKMSKKAIKNPAKEKNPFNQVGYVKSLYFAYLIMSKRGLFIKGRYTDAYNERAVKREVMNADDKIEARQEGAQNLAKAKRKERETIKKVSSPGEVMNPDIPIKPKRFGSPVGKVGSTDMMTKKTGMIKTIKRK